MGLLAFAQAAHADNYAKSILSDTPTGYWRLNETTGTTAIDSSGNIHPANYQSDLSTYQQAQTGFLPYAANAAVHFNGGSVFGPFNANSAIISQDSSPNLNPFAYNNNFTIEAWIRDTSPLPVDENDPNFGSRMFFANNFGFGLTELNEPHFVTYGRKDFILSSVKVQQNQWHQMAVTFTGQDATFYVDGANVGVVNVGHATIGAAQTLTQFAIGRRTTAQSPWLGDVDELSIFNTVLGDDQILNHFQAALSEFGDANGDGQIGFADLVALAQHYGQNVNTFKSGDFDDNGKVDFADLVTVAQHYGGSFNPQSAAPVSVPEPGMIAIAAPLALLLFTKRRTSRPFSLGTPGAGR